MCILSIDIGVHNLGYAVYDVENNILNFDVYDIDKHKNRNENTVIGRVKAVSAFLDNLFMKYTFTKVIIERQVSNNICAMEMMYLLAGIINEYGAEIVIFDPKCKFTALSIPYDTRNKAHKKLSVMIAENYITKYYNVQLKNFQAFKKKDDIADAVFMLFVELFKGDAEKLNEIRQCSFPHQE